MNNWMTPDPGPNEEVLVELCGKAHEAVWSTPEELRDPDYEWTKALASMLLRDFQEQNQWLFQIDALHHHLLCEYIWAISHVDARLGRTGFAGDSNS